MDNQIILCATLLDKQMIAFEPVDSICGDYCHTHQGKTKSAQCAQGKVGDTSWSFMICDACADKIKLVESEEMFNSEDALTEALQIAAKLEQIYVQ